MNNLKISFYQNITNKIKKLFYYIFIRNQEQDKDIIKKLEIIKETPTSSYNDFFWEIDANLNIKFISPQLLRIINASNTNYNREQRLLQLITTSPFRLAKKELSILEKALHKKKHTHFKIDIIIENIPTHYECSLEPIFIQNVCSGYYLFNKNISHFTSLIHKYKQLSMTDSLTNIWNRRYFLQWIEAEFNLLKNHNKIMTVLVIDCDNFKSINDQYGHNVGDIVLKRFATIAQQLLNEQQIIARLGGEEFVICLPNCSINTGLTVASNLQDRINNNILHIQNRPLEFSVSIGISQSYLEECDAQQTLQRADLALYDAKHKGKNNIQIQT